MEKIILARNTGGAYDQLDKLDNIFKIETKEFNTLNQRIKHILELSEENKKKIIENPLFKIPNDIAAILTFRSVCPCAVRCASHFKKFHRTTRCR